MIEIIPAVDIIDGQCVRLTKGDYDTKKHIQLHRSRWLGSMLPQG